MRLLRPALAISLAAASALVSTSAAAAGYEPGGPAPGACTGAAFADRVGTGASEALTAGDRPERVYGLGGGDLLRSGPLRAACLFGGAGTDLLQLGPGGGIALGEEGADIVVGAGKDDALSGGPGADLLVAKAGGDVLRGDAGIDGFDAGPGDDAIVSADGRREVVICGKGTDAVAADRSDVAFGCERVRHLGGRPLRRLRATPARGGRRTIFRLRLRMPQAGGPGAFAVLAPRCADSAPAAVTVFPAPGRRVRAGQRVRVGLRPPRGGWCSGIREAALVRVPECDPASCAAQPPLEPLATVRLRVR